MSQSERDRRNLRALGAIEKVQMCFTGLSAANIGALAALGLGVPGSRIIITVGSFVSWMCTRKQVRDLHKDVIENLLKENGLDDSQIKLVMKTAGWE